MATWSDGDLRVDGANIHYYRMGDATKQPVVLLHGFTDAGLCWMRLASSVRTAIRRLRFVFAYSRSSAAPIMASSARADSCEAPALNRPLTTRSWRPRPRVSRETAGTVRT